MLLLPFCCSSGWMGKFGQIIGSCWSIKQKESPQKGALKRKQPCAAAAFKRPLEQVLLMGCPSSLVSMLCSSTPLPACIQGFSKAGGDPAQWLRMWGALASRPLVEGNWPVGQLTKLTSVHQSAKVFSFDFVPKGGAYCRKLVIDYLFATAGRHPPPWKLMSELSQGGGRGPSKKNATQKNTKSTKNPNCM